MQDTTVNPYVTAEAVLNPIKVGRFRQLPGQTRFGNALIKCKGKLNRAWEIKDGKYTGNVKVKYLTKSGEYKESIRSKQELINHLVSIGAMPKLS